MLKKLENIFILACGIAFIAAALCTVALWIAGAIAFLGGMIHG